MSIQELPSGQWRAQVHDPATGKNVSVGRVLGGNSTFATRKEAQEARAAAREMVRIGRHLSPEHKATIERQVLAARAKADADARERVWTEAEQRRQAIRDKRERWLSEGYVVNSATGCWDWQGSTDPRGYGWVRRAGRDAPRQTAHRWFFEQIVGPIPEGLQLDHLCRNPGCVNPDHLDPVTAAENIRRAGAARRR